jgi:hypothetical protein
MKSLNYKMLTSRGFFSDEKVDFALCSNSYDAELLSKQIQADSIDTVEFSPPVGFDSNIINSTVLVLLAFFENTNSAYAVLNEINESYLAKFKGSKERIFLKHHPRTSINIQIAFNNSFKEAFNNEEYQPPFLELQKLVDSSKLIFCVGETSAANFAFKRAPNRTILAKSADLDKYREPSSNVYPPLSEYLLRIFSETTT